MDKKNKNDYAVTVFDGNGFLVKVLYVHNLFVLSKWLDNSDRYNTWLHFNVYYRRSGNFIKQYKKGSYIDQQP